MGNNGNGDDNEEYEVDEADVQADLNDLDYGPGNSTFEDDTKDEIQVGELNRVYFKIYRNIILKRDDP
jgi:hypothetical protein